MVGPGHPDRAFCPCQASPRLVLFRGHPGAPGVARFRGPLVSLNDHHGLGVVGEDSGGEKARNTPADYHCRVQLDCGLSRVTYFIEPLEDSSG